MAQVSPIQIVALDWVSGGNTSYCGCVSVSACVCACFWLLWYWRNLLLLYLLLPDERALLLSFAYLVVDYLRPIQWLQMDSSLALKLWSSLLRWSSESLLFSHWGVCVCVCVCVCLCLCQLQLSESESEVCDYLVSKVTSHMRSQHSGSKPNTANHNTAVSSFLPL